MGTGKSTVGRRVAATLGRPFLDSDELIEQATGRTVRQIWRTDGESAFRILETDALRGALASEPPAVIAAAGGVVLSAANRDALNDADATVVWLSADPEVLMVRREPQDTSYVGELWHTDTTMVPEPPMGAILYGIDVPPYGGDTMFANQYLAYEGLSPTMKRLLEGLRAVHSDIGTAGPHLGKNKERSTKYRDDAAWRETRNTHPIVRTHVETGRKCLFVNASYTVGIEGMTDAEGKALLGFLLEHGHRPEFTFRFRWQKGSIAFWDNRSTKHIALGDTGPFRRLMRRVQVGGGGVPV